MKRKYVLFVPVAAVTLWLNGMSGTTSVNAAGLQNASPQPALVYQDADREQDGQRATGVQDKKNTHVTANLEKEKQNINAIEHKNPKATQLSSVAKAKNTTKVTTVTPHPNVADTKNTTKVTTVTPHPNVADTKNATKAPKNTSLSKESGKTTVVDAATKEKRKQALAADYKNRQQNGETAKSRVDELNKQGKVASSANKVQDVQNEQKEKKTQKDEPVRKIS